MESIVQLQHVTKIIKGRKIIDDLSFDVYKGEVFGFLGPNGAGKTTTIRMIVGLMSITSGDVIINGKSIKKDFEGAIQNVGAIVENPELYKFLSGYKNLVNYARMHKGITKEKIMEVVELVGLTSAIHNKVKTYSLGMRQRLGLAQCLLHDPKVLILDEPTNGLDPAGIREIRDHIRILAEQRGMAVIVSSHMLSEMEMMCDRIGIIQSGKLIEVQQVKDFVSSDLEQLYRFEISRANEAKEKLDPLHPDWQLRVMEEELVVKISKEEIPKLVKWLVQNNFDVFMIHQATKSLEERFLEVTNGKDVK